MVQILMVQCFKLCNHVQALGVALIRRPPTGEAVEERMATNRGDKRSLIILSFLMVLLILILMLFRVITTTSMVDHICNTLTYKTQVMARSNEH